jgi:hypothetical protein
MFDFLQKKNKRTSLFVELIPFLHILLFYNNEKKESNCNLLKKKESIATTTTPTPLATTTTTATTTTVIIKTPMAKATKQLESNQFNGAIEKYC